MHKMRLLLILVLVGVALASAVFWGCSRFLGVAKMPDAPTVTHTILITSNPPGAHLYTVGPQGGPGQLIGETPSLFRLGFAPMRSRSGSITNWMRWHGDTGALWEHSPEGVVSLNAFLALEGYEVQPVIRRPLFTVDPVQAREYQVEIPMLRPTQPVVLFEIQADSVPSDATIYAVHDGSPAHKLGETPHRFTIGLAQEIAEPSPGQVVHADWHIWDPYGILHWQTDDNGGVVFTFVGALDKDGYVLTYVEQEVLELVPGQPIPERAVITMPMSTVEEEALSDPSDRNGVQDTGPIILQHPAQDVASREEVDTDTRKMSWMDRLRRQRQ